MRRGLLAALSLSISFLVLGLPGIGSAQKIRTATLSIAPIEAVFDSDRRETTYSVLVSESDPSATLSYRWTLTLQAVDDTKGVDTACNNEGGLSGSDKEFVWHHGNEGDPISNDHCNHDLQGKYGHQGLIGLTLTDSVGWQCTATYKGTLSSDAAKAAGLDAAGQPACTGPSTAPPPPPPPKAKSCDKERINVAVAEKYLKLIRDEVERLKLALGEAWKRYEQALEAFYEASSVYGVLFKSHDLTKALSDVTSAKAEWDHISAALDRAHDAAEKAAEDLKDAQFALKACLKAGGTLALTAAVPAACEAQRAALADAQAKRKAYRGVVALVPRARVLRVESDGRDAIRRLEAAEPALKGAPAHAAAKIVALLKPGTAGFDGAQHRLGRLATLSAQAAKQVPKAQAALAKCQAGG